MTDAIQVERGWRADTPEQLSIALEAIIDYRGDVTITRTDGSIVAGYVFDGEIGDRRRVRLLPADGGPAVSVPLGDIGSLEVTGRDTAEGKSFQTWVKKYVERKLAGKPANIEDEGAGDACESS